MTSYLKYNSGVASRFCAKILFIIFIIQVSVSQNGVYGQGCPPNLDFELGNFTGWDCFVGNTTSAGGQNFINLTATTPVPGRHEIVSAFSPQPMDPFGNFPKLCPYGGAYSVKLGNSNIGAEAEGISYTFTVPPTQDTFTFTYFYAVVFQNPSHALYDQPRFFVTAYDVLTGNLISCASYDYVSTSGLPGFEVSPINNTVLFKKWSPVSIQFAGLANRQVRLEFKTADCVPRGHFGYAYIDVSSGCTDILATAPYCIETNSLMLNAPYGFQSYTWYNQDYSVVLGNTQSITLSPPPVTSGVFHVDMIPYPSFGCRDTADAIVVPLPVPDPPAAQIEYLLCQYAAVTPLTATALPGHDLLWYTSATGGIGSLIAPVPNTATPGVFDYYVTQKKLLGCESLRLKITVTVLPVPVPSFTINNPAQCLNNNHFVFTSNSGSLQNATYHWNFGDGNTLSAAPTTISHVYATDGVYNVTLRVTNMATCPVEVTLPVTVHPKPVPVVGTPPVICQNNTVVSLTDQSFVPGGGAAVVNWWWNLNGNTYTTQNPPPFSINSFTPYPVQLAVTSSLGCQSDTPTIYLQVRHQPVAFFKAGRAFCENELIQFTDQSYFPAGAGAIGETITQWNWQSGNSGVSSLQNPAFNYALGNYHVRLTVTSGYGCNSEPFDSLITIHPKPFVAMSLSDSCAKTPVLFRAADLSGTVNNWYWNFGAGFSPGGTQVPKVFNRADAGTVLVSGETIHGCRDTVSRAFTIYDNLSFAGNDTSGPVNEPVQLNANGGSNIQYLWSPPDGLSDARIENPIATMDRDMLYNLYSISDKGCVARSKIFILRYKGPDIYVPTAFSPNNDGVNDLFRAVAYGITRFNYLAVYDRYGNEVFRTSDIRRGWDGTYKGTPVEPGAYVYMAHGTDFKGREISKKGTVVLIR